MPARIRGIVSDYTPDNLMPIPGYGKRNKDILYYGVTPDGRVWSYPRKNWRKGSGIWLKPDLKKGYHVYALYYWHPVKKRSVKKYIASHRLVAMAYIPTHSFRRQVNHKDGNKLNNHYTNLEWATPLENTMHAIRTGLRPDASGENNANAKLRSEDVVRIRQLFSSNKKPNITKLAIEYGVNRSTIHAIISGRIWKHIKEQELANA